MIDHDYLSTSCLHGHHDHCLSTKGPDGPKVPGQCKWCPAMCRCTCHRQGVAR